MTAAVSGATSTGCPPALLMFQMSDPSTVRENLFSKYVHRCSTFLSSLAEHWALILTTVSNTKSVVVRTLPFAEDTAPEPCVEP